MIDIEELAIKHKILAEYKPILEKISVLKESRERLLPKMMIAHMLAICPEAAQAFNNLPAQKIPPSADELEQTMRKLEVAKLKRERKNILRLKNINESKYEKQ